MKLYLAYRYTGEPYDQLVQTMTRVVAICHSLGLETFCSMLMEDEWRAQWRDYDQILAHCLTELDSCDAMLALIWTDEVSNGMQVELEHLQASNKPLFLVIREDLDVWNFRQYAQWIAQYTDDGMYDAVFKVLGM